MKIRSPLYLRKGKTLIKVDGKGQEVSRKSYASINEAKVESRSIVAAEGQGSVRVL